jgi:hypothetical protein
MTSSSKATSATLRAMGATWATEGVAEAGQTGTRPNVALKPTSPQNDAGMRIEPPPSVPSAAGTIRAATPAAAPALDPPAVNCGFHGLRVTPVSGESPTAFEPSSLVVVLPVMHAPARRRRSTDGASALAMLPL